jgi:ribosomal protein S18 acetylase RimI-like enzyme
MAIEICEVRTGQEWKQFVSLPYRIYRGDPNWAPPLRSEEKKRFDARHNPMLHHCEVALFLAFQNGEPVGRISAFIDHLGVKHWNEPIGLFGSFECLQKDDVPQRLLETARDWLRKKSMTRMRGPWSFDSQEWGLVVKGGDQPPMIMAPYNPPFYPAAFESFGLTKVKDLMVYGVRLDSSYHMPERFVNHTRRVAEKYGVRVRSIDMKHLEADVRSLVRIANEATQNNWGYIPVTDAEAENMAKGLKMIVDPDLVMIAESEGRPIGYQITLPDVNVILKNLNGRLFPFGFLKLMTGLKKIRQYRIWALGVLPEFHRRAIDTLLYQKMYEVLKERQPVYLEANYVLEDNMAMNNPILKLGMAHVKTYRVYEASL